MKIILKKYTYDEYELDNQAVREVHQIMETPDDELNDILDDEGWNQNPFTLISTHYIFHLSLAYFVMKASLFCFTFPQFYSFPFLSFQSGFESNFKAGTSEPYVKYLKVRRESWNSCWFNREKEDDMARYVNLCLIKDLCILFGKITERKIFQLPILTEMKSI